MKILILGGTGAMGTPLVDILSQENDVYVTTRNPNNSKNNNIHYLIGNGKNNDFLSEVLSCKYDVIVDFLSYTTEEYRCRYIKLLNSTNHLIFLSSARVYSNDDILITEKSPLLIDKSNDNDYLLTDEYALAKARQERLLNDSGYKNYTILRPYITYNDYRLQLGVYEKEIWLYRLLNNKTILIPETLLSHYTTMTYGNDVAYIISRIIKTGQESNVVTGETYNIVTNENMLWKDVINIYIDIIEKVCNIRPKIKYINDISNIEKYMGNKYQLEYDRLFDRKFNNGKVLSLIGDYKFIRLEDGLRKSITNFIANKNFRHNNWKIQGYFDKVAKEYTPIREIEGLKNKGRYLFSRLID